jgi:hypothetical protein
MPKKQVFLLYNNESEKDLNVANQFAAFLNYTDSPLTLNNVMAGEDVASYKEKLINSDVIVPVFSIDFLHLDSAIEMLEEAKKSNKNIFPILFRPCPWEGNETLKSFEESMIPKDKPLNEFEENHIEGVLNKLLNKIQSVLFNGSSKEKAPVDKLYVLLFFIVFLFAIFSGFIAYNKWYLAVALYGIEINVFPWGKLMFISYVLMNAAVLFFILTKIFPNKFSKKRN